MKKKTSTLAHSAKTVDPHDYQRQPLVPSEVAVDEIVKPTAVVKNVELLFPEWNITGESWNEAYEETDAIRYPTELGVATEKSVRALYNLLEPEVVEVKGKKAPPKAKAFALADADKDDTGRHLPRVIVDSQSTHAVGSSSLSSSLSSRDQYEWTAGYTVASAAVAAAKAEQTPTDPVMCAIFDIVARFAPSFLESSAANHQSPPTPSAGPLEYLWNSIYPKVAAGNSTNPCYNTAGRYCVRLHFAGKWRKVYINDNIPLREDGTWALPRSKNEFELWPTLLAKAVYSAYHQCRYEEFNLGLVDPSKRRAAFSTFALYALTGWLPSQPTYLPAAIEADKPRVQGIIQEMLFGGAAPIDKENIPSAMPTESYNDVGTQSLGEGSEERIKTKKLFKEEYDRRQAAYHAALAARNDRENKIHAIDTLVRAVYDECFVVQYTDVIEPIPVTTFRASTQPQTLPPPTEVVVTLPILGVSLPLTPQDGSPVDLTKVSFLVQWHIEPGIATAAAAVAGASEINAASSSSASSSEQSDRIQFPVLEPMTKLHMQWITADELAAKGAYIFSLESTRRVNIAAQLGWHWSPVPAGAKAGSTSTSTSQPKEKEGKGKQVSVSSVPSADSLCQFPGVLPFVAVALDTRSFFTADSSSLSPSSSASQEVQAWKSKSSHLSLSIAIQGDMMQLPGATAGASVASETAAAAAAAVTGGDAPLVTVSQPSWTLHDNIVVVLEEFRDDDEEPLVMRLELSKASALPLTRATFHIPADKLPRPTNTGSNSSIVFWVRLLSQSSVFLTFRSDVAINLGEAADVWKGVNALTSAAAAAAATIATSLPGSSRPQKYILAREGTMTAPLRAMEERLLFRLPLKTLSTSSTALQETTRLTANVFASLHIADPTIARHVTLAILTSRTGASTDNEDSNVLESFTLPRLAGNIFQVPVTFKEASTATDVGVTKTVIARVFSNSANLPSFKWNLTLLSSYDLVDANSANTTAAGSAAGPAVSNAKVSSSAVANKAAVSNNPNAALGIGPNTIFSGQYHPNNKLQLFSDVYSFDRASFPLALKLSLRARSEAHGESVEVANDDLDSCEDVALVIRMYRKADRQLVLEAHGRSIIPLYQIDANLFCAPAAIAASAPAAIAVAPTKRSDSSSNVSQPAGASNVDILIECCIDESKMRVPESWRAKSPYSFTGSLLASIASGAPSDPHGSSNSGGSSVLGSHPGPGPFQWRVEILAGVVVNVVHDIHYLEKCAAIKNSWEDQAPGRTEQARAAMDAFYLRKALQQIPKGSATAGGGITENTAPTASAAASAASKSAAAPRKMTGTGSSLRISPTGASRKNSSLASSSATGAAAAEGAEVPPTYERLMELLAAALKKEKEATALRYNLLQSLPQYREHIVPCSSPLQTVAIEKEEIVRGQQELDDQIQRGEERIKAAADSFGSYSQNLREITVSRIDEIAKSVLVSNVSVSKLWEERELYRQKVDSDNQALQQRIAEKELADRALAEGITIEEAMENEAKKAAGKGKRK